MGMIDREKVMWSLSCCFSGVPDACSNCHYDNWPSRICVQHLTNDAYALLKEQEPVKPVFERQFMSNIELYDCGKCGTSLGAKGIAKYCMACGRAVKWE